MLIDCVHFRSQRVVITVPEQHPVEVNDKADVIMAYHIIQETASGNSPISGN